MINVPTLAIDSPQDVITLLEKSGFCKSKSQARRLIQGGGVKFDKGEGKKPISNLDTIISEEGYLWAGKKKCIKIALQKEP